MLENVRNDIWKVILCYQLLSVTQLSYSLSHLLCLFRRERQTEFLKVTSDISLAAVLAKSILSLSSEPLRYQVVAVKVVLVVSIGMNSSYLSEHVFSNNWRVGGNGYSRISLYKSCQRNQLTLNDISLSMEHIL